MDEEDIVTGGEGLTRHQQMMQYAQLGGYFVVIYLACYLLCRLIQWEKLGRAAALVQGLVLLVVAAAIYSLWALRVCRLEEGYDLVKAFGLGFLTLLVCIGGAFHGEYGRLRLRSAVVDGPLPEEPPPGENSPDAVA